MERQIFGFNYQSNFIKKNHLTEDKNYTGKYDAYSKSGLPIQIKTFKNKGELMMADPFRYLAIENDFILVIANRDNYNKVISEKSYLIKSQTLKTVLEKNNFKSRAEYCKSVLSSVTNSRDDDAKFKKLMEEEKKSRKGSIINMQAKRDHKSQKRVQWSIPNRHIKTFLSFFEEININEKAA